MTAEYPAPAAATPAGPAPWQWVETRLGVRLPEGPARELLGLALRCNPRRAHLLVSQVLGKHVPQRPATVYRTGYELGRAVRELLGAEAASAVVLGYAETATGLGHCVADGLGGDAPAPYLHSTRRPVPGLEPVGGFEEEHSHATTHLLLPEDPAFLATDGALVLVDDELSTGRTVVNTITDLHARHPRARYVVAALVDLRDERDREQLAKTAAELGARIDVVATVTGTVGLPDDGLARGAALVAAEQARQPCGSPTAAAPAPLRRIDLGWPLGLPDGGRHGYTSADRARLDAALPGMAHRLAEGLGALGAPATGTDRPRRVLVLGTEELMYTPLRLAAALQTALDGVEATAEVLFSTTTRSPVLAVDDPGYAIRTRLAFPAHDAPADGDGTRYAYNIAPGRDADRRFDAVVLVVDSEGDRPQLHTPGRGLLDRLRAITDLVLLAAVPAHRPTPSRPTPRDRAAAPDRAAAVGPVSAPAPGRPLPAPLYGPAFSSYAADEVSWLLKDLSGVALEAPTEEREEAVQQGGAHYAESLPVEYQPTAAYQELFQQALRDSAGRIAEAVATVTETVLAERGPGVVLTSLARAGTPVGILMRRWAQYAHGLELPHYAVSIVRGRGIDSVALRYLAAHHDPADVLFVDGWTGKGAITRELAAALADTGANPPGFNPEMAVLADPAHCVRTFGTREDFLIPSACLNSTVSGLISRTVLRPGLIGPDDFHGAKYYRDLAPTDVSGQFLDAVTARFPDVRTDARTALDDSGREPDWSGWAAVERISEEYGIHSVNLVKPGVGETTRVLLRRVPWRVLVRRGADADLGHVRLLAEQRGVPVETVDELPYSCVGLIHPQYTRGATGDEGTAV
ncbi:phosphoribosyltransferase [Streptacidiphilus sp. PB12-B1b]|uniref:phosphoribosyltransferase n=1 Tax=Streptacidiphilus sp. PB12-B1b TaxID=2705012 RepID=UPI0015F7DCCC|nr:phosphoribosyltransferase [Streptacidiphilus sp. PB12-B1b]QMU75645.1 phosphoribosyltransferase [Streptacidiphilus sp. PB12-B1b]